MFFNIFFLCPVKMLVTKFIMLILIIAASVIGKNSEQSVRDMILQSAPWRVKMMILKNMEPEPTTKAPSRRVAMELLKHFSVNKTTSDTINSRRQRGKRFKLMEAAENIGEKSTDGGSTDDNSLKIKIFRLMYETIRDSDVKVRRAELIREFYLKVPTFNIGFLVGEVQDKYDIMMEFRSTLRKFYDAWKPIEHINAYEQIANYAVELNDLVGLIQALDKNRTRGTF